MDTFMDKLAQKLNAQEMIKANAAADAAELSRSREQNAEYEALLEQIRESSGQNAENADRIAQNAAKLEQSAAMVEQNALKLEQGAAIAEQSAAKLAQNFEMAGQGAAKMEQSALQVEQGAAKVEQSALQVEQGAAKVEQSALQVEQGAVKVEQNAARIESLVAAGIAKIEEIQAAPRDTEELNTQLGELKKILTEQMEQLTDHVHKEDVKVYRNVQAVVVDETAKQNEIMGKSFADISGNLKTVMGVSVVAMLAAAAGIVFQVLVYLHII